MFEKFVKAARHLERYRDGPHADERIQFLTHLVKAGYSRGRLDVINRLLLSVAENLSLDGGARFTVDRLTSIATEWIRAEPGRGGSGKSLRVRELDFLFVAKLWMSHMGRLDMSGPPEPLEMELTQFIEFLRVERGFADVTIENRRKSLKAFFVWLDGRGLSLPEVGLDEIEAYQKECGQRGWKRTTISFHAQSLRSFFRYAESRGWATAVASGIGAPRLYANESIPDGPGWDDVQRLLGNESGDSPVHIRNRAMLFLFAVYGFRLSEVRMLRLEDLNWETERISIRRTKVRKTHEYPLTHEAGEAILRYLKEVRPQSVHRVVFLTLRRPYRPLSTGGLSAMVQKRMRAVNGELTHTGPHALRHACARHLLLQGMTIHDIGQHLGHVSTAATRMYAKVDITALREVAELNMSEILEYAEHAERTQTPIIPHGELAGLREVARLHLGDLI